MASFGVELKISEEMEQKSKKEKEALWDKRAKEFSDFMKHINARNGKMNCHRCAMALDDILSNGLPEGGKEKIKAVSTMSTDLYAHDSFRGTDSHAHDSFAPPSSSHGPIDEIYRSIVDDERIVKRVKVYTADESFDVSGDDEIIVIDKDIPSKKRSLKFKRSNLQNITAALQDLAIPGRKGIAGKSEFYLQENAAYGFIILTHKEDKTQGHILNWFRDGENQIYFLDAQNHKNPKTFVQTALPQKGYRHEVFFITCTPPEGFKIKKELMKIVEPKIKSEAMIIDDDLLDESSQRHPGQGSQKSQSSQAIEPQSSQSQNTFAQDILKAAIVYFDGGQGVKQDRTLAFKLLSDAEKLGSIEAKAYLANYYLFGHYGVKIDIPFGMTLLNESIKTGSIQAKIQLGLCYNLGVGVSEDFNMAAKLFEEASLLGSAKAKTCLGTLFLDGVGVPKDPGVAFKYFQEGAQLGSISAMCELGKCFLCGWGVSKDDAQAFEYFQKSAEAGDEEGMFYLGNFYYQGIRVSKDFTMAVKYYKMASELGFIPAMCRLADCYSSEKGLPKDLSLAFHWLSKIAAKSNHARPHTIIEARAYLEAKTTLALNYLNGYNVVEKDIPRAIQLLTECVNNNFARAKFVLGYCYERGIGVPKTEGLAFKFFKEAAEAGNVPAKANLGFMYEKGMGTPKNEILAFNACYEAAQSQLAVAKYNLGVYYEKGIGCTQSLPLAFHWYTQAANLNEQGAKERAQKLQAFSIEKGITLYLPPEIQNQILISDFNKSQQYKIAIAQDVKKAKEAGIGKERESKESKDSKESKESKEDNDVVMVQASALPSVPAPKLELAPELVPALEPVSQPVAIMPPMVFQPLYAQGIQIDLDNRKRKEYGGASPEDQGKKKKQKT